MVNDLSRSMQQQLEAKKNADKESRDKDLKSIEDFKKKVIVMCWAFQLSYVWVLKVYKI